MSKISGGAYVNNTWRHLCRKYLETLVKAYSRSQRLQPSLVEWGRGNRDRSYSVFLALERHGPSCGHRSRGQQKNNDTCAWTPNSVFKLSWLDNPGIQGYAIWA